MFEAIDAGRAHDRLPHLRVLDRRGGRGAGPTPGGARRRRRAGPGPARRLGRAHDGQGGARTDRGRRRPGPLVPPAPPVAPGPDQPPHPPQGPHHRRSRRLHGRGGDRRLLAGRRPRRDRVARHPLPHRGSGRRRPAGRVPGQLGRDRQRAVRRGRSTASRISPSPAGRSSSASGAPRRPAGATWPRLFRALLQLAEPAHPDHHRLLRAGRRAHRRGCWPPPNAGWRSTSSCPGPHADKRFVQLAGEARVRRAARGRGPPLELPALDAARQGDDRRRLRGQHRLGQPQHAVGVARRGDQRGGRRRGISPRSSTSSSTRTSSAASASNPAAGSGGRARSAWPRPWSVRSGGSSEGSEDRQGRRWGANPAPSVLPSPSGTAGRCSAATATAKTASVSATAPPPIP